jgi:hypothetical protein
MMKSGFSDPSSFDQKMPFILLATPAINQKLEPPQGWGEDPIANE